MAINKKGKTNFLGGTTAEDLSGKEQLSQTVNGDNQTEEKAVRKHKDVRNWGRPRKNLIKGVKETTISVQLPDTLLKQMRKIAKTEKISLKEVIGRVLIEKYVTPQND